MFHLLICLLLNIDCLIQGFDLDEKCFNTALVEFYFVLRPHRITTQLKLKLVLLGWCSYVWLLNKCT